MTTDRQQLGKRGESIAKHHLERSGYTILQANYRAKGGEIDLVGEKDGALIFFEVRSRRGSAMGLPEESMTPRKRAHLVAAAQEYLQVNHVEAREWRIDLVAIVFGPGGRVQRLDVVQNAVEM